MIFYSTLTKQYAIEHIEREQSDLARELMEWHTGIRRVQLGGCQAPSNAMCKGCGAPLVSHEPSCSYCRRAR